MSTDDLEEAFAEWFAALEECGQGRAYLSSPVHRVCAQVRRVVNKRLSMTNWQPQKADVENACQDALTNLCRKMSRVRETGSIERPANPRAYLNTAARNACHDAIRRRYPFWFSMASSIQYKAGGKYELWEHDAVQVCGFALHKGDAPLTARGPVEMAIEPLRSDRDWSKEPVEDLVAALLRAAGRPVPMEMLVDLALACTGVKYSERSLSEKVSDRDGDGVELINTLSTNGPDPEESASYTEFVCWLGREVLNLPRQQGRVAGLNLEMVAELPLESFVEAGAITEAEFVGLIEPIQLESVEKDLPLETRRIAMLLALTEKVVANLRGSARERIRRHCRKRLEASRTPMADPSGISRLWQKTMRKST